MKKYLLNTHPEIFQQLHSKNTFPLNEITYGSKKKLWWICDKGHEWEAVVCNRTGLGHGCPFCAGQKATKLNCLSKTHPELIKTWNYTRNSQLPEKYMAKSNKKVWWICDKGHEWEELISNRTRPNQGCPFCSGHKVSSTNCLSATHPELIDQWHFKNKIKPTEITAGSNIKVWWKCQICKNIWKTKIAHRTSGHGCPKCRQSKGELEIEKYLIKNKIKHKKQCRFKSCKNKRSLPFDFVVKNNLGLWIVEYQGEQHYGPVFGENNYLRTVENDLIKSNWCKINNLPFLSVPYWDFDNIEKLLSNFIKQE